MSGEISTLDPASVWRHFATLCAVPRASRQEAALRDFLIAWAAEHGIRSRVDGAGNLLLSKPGSPGSEHLPGVILQGHLDMVCQANAGVEHDFLTDPIHAVARGGWVLAEHTTLGADNGIGVALALAALEDETLAHPPLEVLLTVNEESGMDGARGLEPGELAGKMLINLDSEEWGHFYLGCSGGVDVEVRDAFEREMVPQGYSFLRFEVTGLRGGHSGLDIHLGRGNAVKLLAEALRDLAAHSDVRLVAMNGGTARNAIPREAWALCAVPDAIAATIDTWVEHRDETWKARYAEADAQIGFSFEFEDDSGETCINPTAQERLLAFLDVCANGVFQMSDEFPGVVDTSSNLGVMDLEGREFMATFKIRSLADERRDALAQKLESHAHSYGLLSWSAGAYPGWTPNSASPLLARCQQVYRAEFGAPAQLQVIHAGLECGLLAASHPDLDMISFGPDIRGAHAPGERVEIASVAHCWQLLKAVLTALAGK